MKELETVTKHLLLIESLNKTAQMDTMESVPALLKTMEQAPLQVAIGFQQISDTVEGRLTSVTIKDSKSLSIINQSTGEQDWTFRCDAVFNQDMEQEMVYEGLVKPMLSKAMLGYNMALIVCGTNAAGKSRLLQGDEQQDGIVSKILKRLFEVVKKEEDHQKHLITVSNIQFHSDGSTVDLLNPHDREIQCLHHSVMGLITEELSEIVAFSCEEAWSLYFEGIKVQKLAGAHLHRCSTVFTITVERLQNSGSCTRSSIQIFDLSGWTEEDTVSGATPLEQVLSAEPSHGCLASFLRQPLGGNSYSLLIYCLNSTESWPGQTVTALTLIQKLMDLTNNVTQNCWDYKEVTQNLRSNIREIRMKLSSNGDLCSEDAKQLGRLVQELQMVKNQRWEKRNERSQQCKEERRQHLTAKGLQDPDSGCVPSQCEQLSAMSQRGLAQQYNLKMQHIRRVKEQLKELVAQYLKAGSRSTDETRTLLSGIQGLRETLQSEEKGLHHIRQKLEMWAKISHANTALFHTELDQLYAAAMKRRKRLAEDNASLVQRELSRMERELQQQKTSPSESTVAPDELLRLRREREVVVFQLVALRREKNEAEKDLEAMHHNYKAELENQKLQALQVLREFREVSQLKLDALEKRYHKLLQEAIQDAVQLSAQKQQLELEKKLLKQRIAELCDQLSATKQQEVIPHPGDAETHSHQFPQ
ncbi:chromosome-associated kinesin KIF4B-like [Stegostoma tigrinum]|uniref:chromosome-associated kinesin KIF4B-like n=1 Tax=Stegostoma tigrinum TaxID=3053191 RepID=UPI002870AFD9|nr:chromosome-associated kinesin KIF4B-like [Stegostoma tigrinum]